MGVHQHGRAGEIGAWRPRPSGRRVHGKGQRSRKVKSAMFYPCAVLVVAVGV
jgi:hypothetical protein